MKENGYRQNDNDRAFDESTLVGLCSDRDEMGMLCRSWRTPPCLPSSLTQTNVLFLLLSTAFITHLLAPRVEEGVFCEKMIKKGSLYF